MKLADKIKFSLINQIGHSPSDLLIPNFFYNTSYEMDLFKLSKAGIVTEYEIKISRADFKNDFKKSKHDSKKHDDLLTGKRICNYFYFVVPENMVAVDEIPDYCGLIYFNKHERFTYIRTAKKLHKNKFAEYAMLCNKLSHRCMILQDKIRSSKFDEKLMLQEIQACRKLLDENNIKKPNIYW